MAPVFYIVWMACHTGGCVRVAFDRNVFLFLFFLKEKKLLKKVVFL